VKFHEQAPDDVGSGPIGGCIDDVFWLIHNNTPQFLRINGIKDRLTTKSQGAHRFAAFIRV